MCSLHKTSVRFALTRRCAFGTLPRMETASDIDVRALRKRLDWSQERLAAFLGVDRSAVSRLEKRVSEGKTPRGPVVRLLRQLENETNS